MRGVGDAGQGGGAGLLALAVAGLSASGSWARRAGGKGSGAVWTAGESGPGREGSWATGFAGPGEEGKARPTWEKGLGLSERSGPRDWV